MSSSARRESKFLAGRQGLGSDASFVFRLGVQLLTRSRKLGSLGPALLVLGRAPSGWSWREALALSRAMGGWCAAQGFTVLTLGETGLSEALARHCERFGGRAVRCVLEGGQAPRDAVAFGSELARRIAVAKLARATLALSPEGEAPGMLLFLRALNRFERLPSRPRLVLGAAQWEFSDELSAATQPIENLEDLSRALELA